MRQILRFSYAVAVLLTFVSSGLAQNVRSAVSTTGTDAATCTVPDPCRTFTAAMARTNPGGEVIALASGGYGPFTITQAVSVISPLAFHAAIAPTAGAAITVNAPFATVNIRGLYLNSQGATNGVKVNFATIVHVESMVINGFPGVGVEMLGNSDVFVKDSEIKNGGVGIGATPESAILTIDRVRLERNLYGLVADSGMLVTVRDTVAARNIAHNFWFRGEGGRAPLLATVENTVASDCPGESFGGGGFLLQNNARVTIRNSAAVRNQNGFQADATGTELHLDQCLAAENSQDGVRTGPGAADATITISNSTVTRNDRGIHVGDRGTVRAVGNTVTKNGIGLSAGAGMGVFESGGHNFVRGNTIETTGTIAPVPTM